MAGESTNQHQVMLEIQRESLAKQGDTPGGTERPARNRQAHNQPQPRYEVHHTQPVNFEHTPYYWDGPLKTPQAPHKAAHGPHHPLFQHTVRR